MDKKHFSLKIVQILGILCTQEAIGQNPHEPTDITVTTIVNKPFYMETSHGHYEGFTVDFAEKLFDKLGGLSYEIKPVAVADGSYGIKDNNTGQWDGMIGKILTNKSDMILADLSVTFARAEEVDFSVPFMSYQLAILMKNSRRRGRASGEGHWSAPFFTWLYSMTAGFWITFMLTSAFLIFLIYFVEKIVSRKIGKLQPPPTENLFAHFGTRVFGTPKSIATRILQVTFCLFILISFCAHVSNFAVDKILELVHETDRKLPLPISTAEELLEHNEIKVGILQGGSTYNYFQTSLDPLISQLKGKIARTGAWIDEYERGIQRVSSSNGNFAFIMESPAAEYAITRKPCEFSVVPNFFGPQGGFAIALPKFSGKLALNKVNVAILELNEEGILDHLQEKWFKDQTQCQPNRKPMEIDRIYGPLTLENLASLFILLTISIFVVFIIAGVETGLNRKTEQVS